jgi:hypothetical protein
MVALGLGCCWCGYWLHVRHPLAARCTAIAHALVALLAGLFALTYIGGSTFIFTDAYLHPSNYSGWAWLALPVAAVIFLIGGAALAVAIGSIWVVYRLATAWRNKSESN